MQQAVLDDAEFVGVAWRAQGYAFRKDLRGFQNLPGALTFYSGCELAEAAYANQLSRALGRWERLDLICIDELGYVPLAETACELMFQVIADRAEKAAVIVTTNLPFSEWSQVSPNPRLCRALIDRLTDRAHIITTGAGSYRFRRTTAQRKAGKA